MTQPAYDPCQPQATRDTADFQQWLAELQNTTPWPWTGTPCRYCGEPCQDTTGEGNHADREAAWDILQALKLGLAEPLPIPTRAYLDGFYGRDHE